MTDEIKEILKGATVQGKFLMYKDILQLIIMNEKETDGKTVPDKIIIQIMKTDPSLSDGDRIVKQELRSGLYEAFELGTIWLERLIGE